MKSHRSDTVIGAKGILHCLIAGTLLVSLGLDTGRQAAAKSPDINVVFVQVPGQVLPQSTGGENSRYVDGCRIMRLSLGEKPPEPFCLTDGFISAVDPSVSFDGKSILFSGKRNSGDSWQIFQMNADGSQVIQITNGKKDHVTPLHVGSLFHLNDAAPIRQIIYGERDGDRHDRFRLISSNFDGAKPRPITFNVYSDYDPDVLPNGRIVFTSLTRQKNISPFPRARLMALNIDGTDLMPFSGDESPMVHKRMPSVGFDKRVYYVESDSLNYLQGGKIVSVSQFRSLHSRKRLSGTKKEMYHSPCPLPSGDLLISCKNSSTRALYEIQRFSPRENNTRQTVYRSSKYHSVDAQYLGKTDPVRGRSSVVGFKHKDTGVFFCMDVYKSDRPDIRKIKHGSVTHVMITKGIYGGDRKCDRGKYGKSSNGEMAGHRLLGIAPVEKDGSFHVRIPSETPVTFHLLNENGMTLARQESWTWTMHGESRGCIGCHEDRELTPPNRFIDAMKKPEVKLLPPSHRSGAIDFIHHIEPIMAKRCFSCHSSRKDKPYFNDPIEAFHVLTGGDSPFVLPWEARKSPLVRAVFGLNQDSMHNFQKCNLTMDELEKRKFVNWVNLGAPCEVSEHTLK